nr:Gfo/Idh/MocA family oxidoreductase [Microbacterium excoecariae]
MERAHGRVRDRLPPGRVGLHVRPAIPRRRPLRRRRQITPGALVAHQNPLGVGFIGVGMISDTYLEHLATFPGVRVVILGDLDTERARSQAAKHGIAAHGSPDDVLAHPGVDLVVNLTIPAVHADVSLAAIEAGKHVWSEKPIATDLASARAVLEAADRKGLRVGIAPDTVLGNGVQTALRAIERGDIGDPLFATTAMQWAGPDWFHPGPEFLFAPGAGPVLDMGPYYVTTLASAFGSVASAYATAQTGQANRTKKVGDRAGEEFPVLVPTTVQATLTFEAGGSAQQLYSWDSPIRRMGFVELVGTEGALRIPDPNFFTGAVRLAQTTAETAREGTPWRDLPVEGVQGGRGLGIADMAEAIREDRPHRASGEMGLHVLETLLAIEESTRSGAIERVASRVARPATVPVGWDPTGAA